MKSAATDGQAILTDGELRDQLTAMLRSGFTQHGNLFVPTTPLYNLLATEQGLQSVFHDICRWLGVKPSGLQVAYTSDQTAPLYEQKSILVPAHYRSQPYATGALLAFAALRYYCERYTQSVPDQEFIEFASIETGLGLWVLNGLPPKARLYHALFHLTPTHHAHSSGVTLLRYTPRLYGHQVAAYAHNNHVLPEQYLGGVSPTHRYLLPEIATHASTQTLPRPKAIIDHHVAVQRLWVRCVLVAGILAACVTVGVLLYANSRPAVSAEQIRSQQMLVIKKASLDACLAKAAEQQNTFDPNDFSLTRQIDATKVRCESLRNEYNFALTEHNDLYQQQ